MIDYLLMSFFYKTGNFQILMNFNKDIQKGQWKFQSFHPKLVDDTV